MQKIRSMIREMNQKVKQMSNNYEPTLRIETYKKETLERIKGEYQKTLATMKQKVEGDMKAIEKEYWDGRPSIEKQAQIIAVAGVKYHSMSDKQLAREAENIRALPPLFIDLEDARTVASQLRSRGIINDADSLAGFIEANQLERAYIHYPEYQALEKTANRLKVYEAQKDIFILSSDPNTINEGDIAHLDALEKVE
jgi:hypothetical protein